MSSSDNPLRQLEKFGQSIWLDYIRRHLLFSPEFRRLIDEDGLKGMTSNPTIFEKAIGGSNDYDEQFAELVRAQKSVDELYEGLTIADIKHAADALRPLYDASDGRDGFVSYEVSPRLANDSDGTIAAAHRYFELIDRPNLMVKVPATPAGLPAIRQLISEGRNINITLMFSIKHYESVAEAYIMGLESRAKAGLPLAQVASVASVFVSRVDTLVDKRLEERLKTTPDEAIAALRGTAAVVNAKLIFQRFKEIFGSDRFLRLQEKVRACNARYGHQPVPKIRHTAISSMSRSSSAVTPSIRCRQRQWMRFGIMGSHVQHSNRERQKLRRRFAGLAMPAST